MTFRSALYIGSVMHRRLRPHPHYFRYRAFWMLIDLEELDELSSQLRWFSYNRANLFSLYDSDHGDGSPTPLAQQIERQAAQARIDLTGGRIQLLCMPRTFGYCFNPLSIFFCYRASGALAAVIYQVHNTFSERHSYLIAVEDTGQVLHQRCRKSFYVSPFLDMDLHYDFRIAGPDTHVRVGIRASSADAAMLSAVMAGARQPLSDRNLVHVCLRMPAITVKVMAAIHWEAVQLWGKRIGLRRRPAPPEREITVVSITPAPVD